MAGAEFDEQFIVGEAAEVVERVGALVEAGLDGLIFNMPLSDPDTVARAGELLTDNFK
jgi:alkanesulfonate monooxygenase SsuD/methylene tetrahydromethanopterin reductase-like flavin-dependent oxidoreductase (luciferase family)